MQDRRRFLATAAAAALLPATAARAAPRARLLDRRWAATGSAAEPDHGAWDAILAAHRSEGRDGIARFDYAAASRGAVAGYIAGLQRIDPSELTGAAAFAYWVNLYNALTVQRVLEAYPVSSIRRIGGSFLNPGPWREKLVRIADRPLSLDDIEHGILRPVWREARVHYAVNCAALGCPNLADRAFTAGRLDRMLAEGARAFVNHPRGARVTGKGLEVSSIYRWFAEDFGGGDAGVIRHLQQHAEAPLRTQLEAITRIASDGYDWRLNAAG